jgi:hypothetical protein
LGDIEEPANKNSRLKMHGSFPDVVKEVFSLDGGPGKEGRLIFGLLRRPHRFLFRVRPPSRLSVGA